MRTHGKVQKRPGPSALSDKNAFDEASAVGFLKVGARAFLLTFVRREVRPRGNMPNTRRAGAIFPGLRRLGASGLLRRVIQLWLNPNSSTGSSARSCAWRCFARCCVLAALAAFRACRRYQMRTQKPGAACHQNAFATPGPPVIFNSDVSTACRMSCTSTQLACQTSCARLSSIIGQ
jgi:hypothetical protein